MKRPPLYRLHARFWNGVEASVGKYRNEEDAHAVSLELVLSGEAQSVVCTDRGGAFVWEHRGDGGEAPHAEPEARAPTVPYTGTA